MLTLAADARADWFVAPFLGVKFAGDTNFVNLDQGASNSRFVFGATAGFVGSGVLGIETDFCYYPRFFERSSGSLVARSSVLTLMGNLLVTVPRDWTGYALRPYVSGGAGYMHVGLNYVADVFRVDSDRIAINVGGGAVGGLTARTDVRFDLRYFKTADEEAEQNVGFGPPSLSFWRAAVGVTIR
jgi:hypothetical protein